MRWRRTLAIVEIHTRGGQRLEGEGTWRNLTLSEVEHKFRDVVGGLLGAGRAARLVDLVYALPRAHSTAPFFEALAGTSALHTQRETLIRGFRVETFEDGSDRLPPIATTPTVVEWCRWLCTSLLMDKFD